jgi:hypothetical protein
MADTRAQVLGYLGQFLPPHVVAGFDMNIQDESGWNAGINEAAPIVPGSRGGFGLYQVTGPRRRDYEAFAAAQGVDPSDPMAQAQNLMRELNGPESAAMRRIMATSTAGDAATAIATHFLRPAASHLAERTARYAGQTGPAGGPAPAPGPAPVDPAMAAAIYQAFIQGKMDDAERKEYERDALSGAFPVPDDSVFSAYLSKQQAARKPLQQANIQGAMR